MHTVLGHSKGAFENSLVHRAMTYEPHGCPLSLLDRQLNANRYSVTLPATLHPFAWAPSCGALALPLTTTPPPLNMQHIKRINYLGTGTDGAAYFALLVRPTSALSVMVRP
eukprot:1147888-Pelagomonas_calceolata.AAC.1